MGRHLSRVFIIERGMRESDITRRLNLSAASKHISRVLHLRWETWQDRIRSSPCSKPNSKCRKDLGTRRGNLALKPAVEGWREKKRKAKVTTCALLIRGSHTRHRVIVRTMIIHLKRHRHSRGAVYPLRLTLECRPRGDFVTRIGEGESAARNVSAMKMDRAAIVSFQ